MRVSPVRLRPFPSTSEMRVLTFIVLLLLTLTASSADAPVLKAGVFDPPRLAPDFSLTGSNGREVRLSDFRGKLVILGFGFTSCPQICPTTLATLAQAQRQLGDDVQVIYVTVDPERDTPEQMRRYLATFDATFIGATGTPTEVAAVHRLYGVMAEKKPAGSTYMVAHSSSTYFIDRQGRLRGMMPYGRRAGDYVHDARILLAQ
jgi:protein SCO1/2